jgi:photosystem II stability/assembly factor-like uncharacterized protein
VLSKEKENIMKKPNRIVLICVLALILAALACQFPGRVELTATLSTQPPLEETTEPPLEETAVPPLEETAEPSPTETIVETETHTPTTSPTVAPTETEVPPLATPFFTNPIIYTIAMFTPTRGWAVTRDQNHLLVTEDGGHSWLEVTPAALGTLPPGSSSFGIQPFFMNQDIAWLIANTAGSANLFHTRDGGQTWMTLSAPFENAYLTFLDQNLGYALVSLDVGAGSHYVAIFRTLNSGETWTMVFTHEPGTTQSLPHGGMKKGIVFHGVDNGWIWGVIPADDEFYLFKTADGGATWAQVTDISLPWVTGGNILDISGLFFVNPNTAFMLVRAYLPDGDIQLLIYRSTDYGQTWAFQNAMQDSQAMDFISPDEGWIASDTTLYHSVDGGITWSAMATSGISAGEVLLKVDFVDSLHGWVVSIPDEMTWEPLKLYRTIDGGASWELLLP